MNERLFYFCRVFMEAKLNQERNEGLSFVRNVIELYDNDIMCMALDSFWWVIYPWYLNLLGSLVLTLFNNLSTVKK